MIPTRDRWLTLRPIRTGVRRRLFTWTERACEVCFATLGGDSRLNFMTNAEVLLRTSYDPTQGLQEARTHGHKGPVHRHDRDVLRTRQPQRIPLPKSGARGAGRAAASTDLRLQLQER